MAIQLSSLKKGKNNKPPRILIYGEEKIGKSTFGADAPDPIFMNIEDGADYIDTTRAFGPENEFLSVADVTYAHCTDLVNTLINEKHDYKTLVVDTFDALESKIIRELCAEKNAASLSDPKVKEFSYGGAYKMVTHKIEHLLDGFDVLRNYKDMVVIIIVHSKKVLVDDDPLDDAHLQHEFRLSSQVEGALRHWADCILLARQELYTKTIETGEPRKKGLKQAIDGQRILCAAKSHAYTGGSRLVLPEVMPLSWNAFYENFQLSLNS
jgi:hypothetical protein